MIKKILIANRGEIAVRIMRTCREMNIESVAVFSEVDRTSMHVRYATEAYCIGPAPSKESYLNIEKIIAVAKMTKADAIHPGYGFLSENEDFAARCKAEGIIFIGPSAYAIATMGDKISARRKMIEAGVKLVQVIWYRGPDEPADAPCWDSHAREAQRLKTVLVPPMDQAYSGLLEDLAGAISRLFYDVKPDFEGGKGEPD